LSVVSLPAAAEGKPSDADDLRLGAQIRDLRKSRGLSLQQVASEARLSVGLLSQIERGLCSPSIRSLRQISEALNVTPGRFFREEGAPPSEEIGLIVRRGQGRQLKWPSNGVTKWLMSPDVAGALEMLLVTIEPGGASGPEHYTHRGEECGFIVRGAMLLSIEERSFLLQEGDGFRFRSTIPHRFENAAPGRSEILWVLLREPGDRPAQVSA
jgi:transcriptional regulator with XRE-family HTH domain